MTSKPKIIIDTDAGVDDAVALFMVLEAHRKGYVEIVAMTTVNGNTSVDNVNINVYRILEIAELTEIPVYSGAKEGIVSKYEFIHDPFHGFDGFGDVLSKKEIPSSLSLLKEEHASLALVRLVKEYPGEIILAAIGPLTNVAIAMNLCPDWSSGLRDFYVMGGNIYGIGNLTISGEFNFVCDPESAKIVLERTRIPIKLTPWETCIQAVNISFEERLKLGSTKTAAAKLLNDIEVPTLHKTRRNFWITCDQLSIAWLLHDYANPVINENNFAKQDFITKQKSLRATVELMGQHTRGQMIIDREQFLNLNENIFCMEGVNKSLYMKYLELAFK